MSVLAHIDRIATRLVEQASEATAKEHHGAANIFRGQAEVLGTVYEHVRLRIHHDYTMGRLTDAE